MQKCPFLPSIPWTTPTKGNRIYSCQLKQSLWAYQHSQEHYHHWDETITVQTAVGGAGSAESRPCIQGGIQSAPRDRRSRKQCTYHWHMEYAKFQGDVPEERYHCRNLMKKIEASCRDKCAAHTLSFDQLMQHTGHVRRKNRVMYD